MDNQNQLPNPKKNDGGADQTSSGGSGIGKGRLRFYLCQTLDCLIEKNIRSCFECDDFPCPKVQEE